MEAVRLAEPVRPRPTEARRGGEHERAASVVVKSLERVPLDRGALVDMAAEDELRSGGRERPQRCVAVLERELPRGAPGRAGEVVVADDDAKRVCRCVAERRRGCRETGRVEPAALVAPRPRRVEPADDGIRGAENRVGRAEDLDEPIPRPCDAGGQRVGDVVVARDGERRRRQAVEERLRLLELRDATAVREIAARDHELRGKLVTERHERIVERRRLAGAAVQVGDVDRARGHGRTRLYTRSMSEQSPEIFDDLYLGLQAGGALRKQRRGEELTEQEEAGARSLAAAVGLAQGDRDRRLRARHLRARLHPRRPHLRPPEADAMKERIASSPGDLSSARFAGS